MESMLEPGIEEYLEYLEVVRGLSPRTVSSYRRDLEQFAVWCEAQPDDPVGARADDRSHAAGVAGVRGEPDTRLVRRFLGELGRRGLSARSVNRTLSAIKGYFRFRRRRAESSPENPAAGIRGIKTPSHLPRFLFEQQLADMIAELRRDAGDYRASRDALILELLYSTGCRVSELAGMELEHLDLPRRRIRVIGKGNKERIVFLTRDTAESLKNYLPFRSAWLGSGSPRERAGGVVTALLLNRDRRPLSVRSIQHIISSMADRFALGEGMHPHMLRHSFATHLMNNGADIRYVQELLGHKNLSTTQVYTHTSLGQLRDVYRAAHPHSRRRK
jgi:integrase/recombinase XerC